MRQFSTYAFLDGGYLRERSKSAGLPWADPHRLAMLLCGRNDARSSENPSLGNDALLLQRTVYYDGVADDQADIDEDLRTYWQAIELLPDTHLGFGSVKRTPGGIRRQKGVDTLLTVEMLSGAFDKLFDLVLLVAGDADFVPLLLEVRRRGVHLVLAADPAHVSDDLKRVCDRFVPFAANAIPALEVDGRVWKSRPTA